MIYLLQHATIRRPLPDSFFKATSLSLDYLRVWKLEGVALDSLAAMKASSAQLQHVEFPEILREDGCNLIGYGVFSDQRRAEYADALEQVVNGTRLREQDTILPHAIQPSKSISLKIRKYPNDFRAILEARLDSFWWDMGNHIMLSFQKDFMENLPRVLRHSWDMNESFR